MGFRFTLPGRPNFCALFVLVGNVGSVAGLVVGLVGYWLNFVCCLLSYLLPIRLPVNLFVLGWLVRLCWLCWLVTLLTG